MYIIYSRAEYKQLDIIKFLTRTFNRYWGLLGRFFDQLLSFCISVCWHYWCEFHWILLKCFSLTKMYVLGSYIVTSLYYSYFYRYGVWLLSLELSFWVSYMTIHITAVDWCIYLYLFIVKWDIANICPWCYWWAFTMLPLSRLELISRFLVRSSSFVFKSFYKFKLGYYIFIYLESECLSIHLTGNERKGETQRCRRERESERSALHSLCRFSLHLSATTKAARSKLKLRPGKPTQGSHDCVLEYT